MTEQILQRLRRLERQNRRLRYATALSVALSLTAWLSGIRTVAESGSEPGSKVIQTGALHFLGATDGAGNVTRQPLINFYKDKEFVWQMGLDVANSDIDDFVLAAKGNPDGSVGDLIYIRSDTSVGIGYTPPPPKHRLAISTPDRQSWTALLLRQGEHATGETLRVINSAGDELFGLTNRGQIGYAAGNTTRAFSGSIERPSGFLMIEVDGKPALVPYYGAEVSFLGEVRRGVERVWNKLVY